MTERLPGRLGIEQERAMSIDHLNFWKRRAERRFEQGQYVEALAAYERAIQFDPYRAEFFEGKGDTLFQLKRYDEALAAADAALKLAPNDPDNWQRKAEALRKLRRGRDTRTAEAQVERLRGGV